MPRSGRQEEGNMSARWWVLVVSWMAFTPGCSDDSDVADHPGGGGTATGLGGNGTGAAPGDSTGGSSTASGGGGSDAGGQSNAGGSDTMTGSANVIAVSVTGAEDSYTFAVTLQTSDIDCSHFADWWEVLTQEGALVYRRILAHPHTEGLSGNPYTRSGGPVAISGDQPVVVRGHMNDLGYVGVAQRGTVNSGFTDATDLAADFAFDVETEDPQPDECIPEEQVVGG